jgi:hypothetical protein
MDNEQPNNGGSSLHLPQFWAQNTEARFAIAETRFRIKRVDDQQEMFDHVVNALPKESLRTVVASVDPRSSSSQPPATIAAVKSGPPARGGPSGGQRGKGRGRGGAGAPAAPKPTSATTPSAVVTPDSMARASSGLCYFH